MTGTSALYLEQLKDNDPAVRRRAVRDLAAFPEGNVVVALCEALGDQSKGVQSTAIETLSQMRCPEVINGLLPVIRGSDLNTRNAGMTVLKSLGPMAIPMLVEALNTAKEVDEIIQILVVLGNIGSPLATDAVMNFVAHEDDNIKTTAVEALGKIQDPAAVKALINAYHQTDILKYSIVEALGNISVKEARPVVMGSLESEDVLEYFSGIGAMGAMEDSECILPLFQRLLKEEDAGTRRLILKSMAQIEDANPGVLAGLDPEAMKSALLPLLGQPDTAEYIYLVKIAAAMNNSIYAESFISALKNGDAEVVETAFNGLVALGEKAVKAVLASINNVEASVLIKLLEYLIRVPHHDVPQAVSSLIKHTHDGVRQVLALTLGANPSDSSFGSLKLLLDDPDETVRKYAVQSMKNMLSYDGVLSALIGRLKDMNGHVRREAALAMKATNSKQVEEPLFNVILTEPYGDVREAAALVLASRKDPDITRRLLECLDSDNSRIRETVARTIWQCGSTLAVDSLIHKLEDKEWRVAVNACFSLGRMKDLKSIFPLKELLKHDDWQIRIAALSALRAFNSKELKQFFIPLLSDQNSQVAKLAVVALSELEDKTLDDTFRGHLEHPRWEVRYQIVKALGKIKSQKAVDSLTKIAEKDPNNGVRAKAILALARINNKNAVKCALGMLENLDRELIVTAVKFFLQFENPDVPDLEDRLRKIFLGDPCIKNYFLESFAQNKCTLLEKVLAQVASPREFRSMMRRSDDTGETGINREEALLLREIIAEKCGIILHDASSIENKLGKGQERFFINSWIEYYHALRYGTDDQNLLFSLYDSITNPTTEFFGEPEQTRVLVSKIIPELIEERIKAGKPSLKILSCGCSFGPEAYCLAMSILEDVHSAQVKISVTGVDISHICLNTAKRGIYKREILRNVDQKYIDLYFEDDRGDLRVKDDVKNLVEFKYLNLNSTTDVEELGMYDVIICRNVFSSFAQKEKERLAENIYNQLMPGGALFIASKESLYNVTKAFRLQTYDKVVAYRKL